MSNIFIPEDKKAIKTSDIAELLGLSMARTRVILSEMDDVVTLGTNRTRRYRLRAKGDNKNN